MTVAELLENGFACVVCPSPEKVITGVYIGDLLSWVMGKARAGDAWITIMSNINIAAVAVLTEVACIITAETVELTDEVKEVALEKGVNILSFGGTAYEAAVRLSSLL